MLVLVLLAVTLFLAYANGANDNFKGAATLYGNGLFTYKQALKFATVAQIAGSLASVLLAAALVKAFSGKGLVSDDIIASGPFLMAIALGAAATVMLATRLGFPISTTHALTGALAGCAFLANEGTLDAAKLGQSYFLPLLASPLLAVVTTMPLYAAGRIVADRARLTASSCVCVHAPDATGPRNQGAGLAAAQLSTAPSVVIGDVCRDCERPLSEGAAVGVTVQAAMNYAHMASAFALCFARGLNDTPKIVGILFAAKAFDANLSLLAVCAAMAVGGWLHSRRVADKMSLDITSMRDGDAFTANGVAAFYVIAASHLGLPVSTTHVTVSAISGVGLVTGRANLAVIRDILLAWVVTLPAGAAFGMASLLLFDVLGATF